MWFGFSHGPKNGYKFAKNTISVCVRGKLCAAGTGAINFDFESNSLTEGVNFELPKEISWTIHWLVMSISCYRSIIKLNLITKAGRFVLQILCRPLIPFNPLLLLIGAKLKMLSYLFDMNGVIVTLLYVIIGSKALTFLKLWHPLPTKVCSGIW